MRTSGSTRSASRSRSACSTRADSAVARCCWACSSRRRASAARRSASAAWRSASAGASAAIAAVTDARSSVRCTSGSRSWTRARRLPASRRRASASRRRAADTNNQMITAMTTTATTIHSTVLPVSDMPFPSRITGPRDHVPETYCPRAQSAESELLRRGLSHLDLADLAGDRHRVLVDDLDVARDLVVGELAGAELAQGLGGERRGAVLHADPRAQLLAVLLVRDADDLGVEDVGVGVEELLDLARVDVLAAADDHVLDAAGDLDVAVIVHDADVAGVHPAVLDGLGRLVGLLPVAEHHGVALGHELPGLAARQGLAGHRVGDLDLEVRPDPADGPDLLLERVVGAVLRRHRRGLGHAVTDRHLLDA